jgi:hypothetical protein
MKEKVLWAPTDGPASLGAHHVAPAPSEPRERELLSVLGTLLSMGRLACLQATPTYSCLPKWGAPSKHITHGAAKAVWRERGSRSHLAASIRGLGCGKRPWPQASRVQLSPVLQGTAESSATEVIARGALIE